jgi:hypothetical protein
MKYIYLVFSKTGTWLSRSISVITKCDYTHVALSFDENFDNMYTFGRLNPKNPFLGGFTTESLYSGVYKSSKVKCLIYKIPVTNNQLNLLKKELNQYLNSDTKYGYNFIGLFGVLVDKPIKRHDRYFCSQFVTTLLEKSTIWQSPKGADLTRPMDLKTITNKKVVYQGSAHEFSYFSAKDSVVS